MAILKDVGIVTAYGYAKENGYEGTESEYGELMANFANAAAQAVAAKNDAVQAKEDTEDIKDEVEEISKDVDEQILAYYPVDTASGSIASFPDGADDVEVKSVTVQIVPKQAGTGDPSPDNVRPISGWDTVTVMGTGANVWDEQWELGGLAGGTGAPYAATDRIRSKNFCDCKPNTAYYLFNNATGTYLYIWWYDASKTFISTTGGQSAGAGQIVNSPATAKYFKLSTYAVNYTEYANNFSVNHPATDTAYHPYEGTAYPLTLPSTVYGGTVDVTNGVLRVDMAMVDIGTLEWSAASIGEPGNRFYSSNISSLIKKPESTSVIPNLVCSIYKAKMVSQYASAVDGITVYTNGALQIYDSTKKDLTGADFGTSMNGVQLVYELATPIEYTLTPAELTTLLGQNNIFADCGDSSVTYRADIQLYIQKMIAAALNS